MTTLRLLFTITGLCVFFNLNRVQAQDAPADTVVRYAYPIQGTVFMDRNGNGIFDESESGIEGVAVSDGYDVVRTNSSGQYLLPNRGANAAFVYVHQPDFARHTGRDFFHILNHEKSAEKHFDFALQPAAAESDGSERETKGVRFVQLSDSHIRNSSDRASMKEALREIARLDPELDFVVMTGDLVDWGVDVHYQNYVAALQGFSIPYFNVFGNHELVFGPVERYHQYIGPEYFSFERAGILFLSLDCVTPSPRQDAWIDHTLRELRGDRPVVVFQHFPPDLQELERFEQWGVASVFSGHWHSEKEMVHAGVQSVNSPPFIMGGIDASPAGFKVVELNADGTAETAWRYGFQDRTYTLVAPRPGAPAASGKVGIQVNAYDTGEEIESIVWEANQHDRTIHRGSLMRESAISWTGTANLRPGTYALRVTVTGKKGTVWGEVHDLTVVGATGKTNGVAAPDPGQDWPLFMGTSGHEGYHAASIGELPLNLAWSRDTGGDPDFASPILADGLLFLALKKRTGDRVNGVAAFDPVTGEKRWLFETELAVNHTPAYWKGTLCIAEMGGRIIGLDAATGKKKWEHMLIDAHGRYNYGAPTAAEGHFYAGVMRRLARIEAETGQLSWEAQAGTSDNDWISSYGSPAVQGDYLAMSGMYFMGQALAVLNTSDGKPVWRHQADNGLLASPTISGNVVLYTSFKSVLYARNVHDGDSIWDRQLGEDPGDGNWSATTPAVKRTGANSGIVVAGSGDGLMYGVDLATGSIIWKHRSGPAGFKMSPYRRDDRPLLSSPVIAGDRVFFGSADGYLYCLDLNSGKELWSHEIGVPVLSTPMVSGNTLYVAAYDGRLYAFTATAATGVRK